MPGNITIRVLDAWNSLPATIINCGTFKDRGFIFELLSSVFVLSGVELSCRYSLTVRHFVFGYEM